MAWFDIDLGQTKTYSHGGNLPDFSAFVGLVPDQKRGVVILLNAEPTLMDCRSSWRRLGWV